MSDGRLRRQLLRAAGTAFRVFGFNVDYQQPSGLGAGGSYTYERYFGLHTSRSASPGQETDPLLQELRIDVRHRLSNRLAATLSYLYEPFRVYDFAMDPTVVDSIVQPSTLVMGYVYRPYTAHSAVIGLMYFW